MECYFYQQVHTFLFYFASFTGIQVRRILLVLHNLEAAGPGRAFPWMLNFQFFNSFPAGGFR